MVRISNVFRTGWGNWDYIAQSGRNSEDMAAFVELHVEQGPILESLGKQIGIVEGIVGQRRYIITVKVQATQAQPLCTCAKMLLVAASE